MNESADRSRLSGEWGACARWRERAGEQEIEERKGKEWEMRIKDGKQEG